MGKRRGGSRGRSCPGNCKGACCNTQWDTPEEKSASSTVGKAIRGAIETAGAIGAVAFPGATDGTLGQRVDAGGNQAQYSHEARAEQGARDRDQSTYDKGVRDRGTNQQ